ncbi:FecCD family ABC transporter permease [Streptomyces prasinopilosus]|uniref:FecCD family ABC transporter permease n=1 Tax=Streptomyces prasinopilosus TaxID=67344 RepID=UPI001F0A96E6|nr:iron ABC transporter permease [Streptomyces prasinopilosus]
MATGLLAGLLLLIPVAAATGAYPVPVGDVLASIQHRLGFGGGELDRAAESVLWHVRFPRIVLALLVGASLGCAGALMQGVFGNPLAEPGVIGVSSGAAVGAVAAIALGLNFAGTWTVPVLAFAAGLVTVLLVYVMSRSGGRTEVVTLILTGIAVNAFAGALIELFLFFADTAAVNQIAFWQLGSLSQATRPKVLAVLPCAVLGLAVAPLYAAADRHAPPRRAPPRPVSAPGHVTVWPLSPVPPLAPRPAPVGFASGKGKVKEPDEQVSRPSKAPGGPGGPRVPHVPGVRRERPEGAGRGGLGDGPVVDGGRLRGGAR